MSDPVLHIKDSFYFEVPKALCPSNFTSRTEFPQQWGRNDPTYQNWEFDRVYDWLAKEVVSGLPDKGELHEEWTHWRDHDHANFAKPFATFLNEKNAVNEQAFHAWKAAASAKADAAGNSVEARRLKQAGIEEFLALPEVPEKDFIWFSKLVSHSGARAEWFKAADKANDWKAYTSDRTLPEWNRSTIESYNAHLAGKILIPPVFGGKARNLYEPDTGFCVTKFMVIEVLVGIVLIVMFGMIARKAQTGGAPKGLLWNLLEVFLVFIRDQIARPAIGGHHDEAGHENEKIDAESQGYATATFAKEHDPHAVAGARLEDKHHHGAAHGHDDHAHHNPFEMADRFVPLLWTIFLFILGCNLCGMIPWIGTPTSAWSVTLGLAIVTFLTVVVAGVGQFGVFGFLKNQIPSMDLPLPMALIIKPMIFGIEMFGLLIKHMVLSIRLLANMVAGHLVLLGIMGIAFSATSAEYFLRPDTPGWIYWVAAICSVGASTALSVLELGVAFLQAYVFTLLSALFIGAAVHKH